MRGEVGKETSKKEIENMTLKVVQKSSSRNEVLVFSQMRLLSQIVPNYDHFKYIYFYTILIDVHNKR